MATDNSKFRNLFPILGMALRRPETFLTWVMAIALSILTASIADEASLSFGPVAVEAWHWLIIGAGMQLALFYGALRNPKSLSAVKTQAFKRELDPEKIRNPDIPRAIHRGAQISRQYAGFCRYYECQRRHASLTAFHPGGHQRMGALHA